MALYRVSYIEAMKTLSPKIRMSRRKFLSSTAVAAAAAPMIVPARLFGADAPSNRIRVGQIGCGRIGRGHDMPGVLNSQLADIVALCDLDSKRLASGKEFVEKFYREKSITAPDFGIYGDYRELLAR